MYKKVYVEITNNCNLKCDFCTLNKRENKFISEDEFKTILDKLKGHTKYLYLHVLGEPLLHPKANDLINMASKDYNINITTNGYLIDRIKDNKNIRQINISLHSFNDKYQTSLNDYLDNIFDAIEVLKKSTYISLRIWVKSPYIKDIISYINNKYNLDIDPNNIKNETKLDKNVFINTHEEFEWPSLDNKYYSEVGTCYALKDHVGILVDGTVIPCCLDGDGIIKLGNIYASSLTDIIKSDRYQNMLKEFKDNKKCEELCKHCSFIKKD